MITVFSCRAYADAGRREGLEVHQEIAARRSDVRTVCGASE